MLPYFLIFTVGEFMITISVYLKYAFTVIFISDILFALVLLPFIIRLSGQLLIQVIKYRSTIKQRGNDSEELIPYYEHYRLFFLVLLALMCFNVFSLIKAFYLIKPLFLYVVEPISLIIVLNLWSGFQDSIISVGLISVLQIAYFLQGKRFSFRIFFCLIVLRFIWMFIVEVSFVLNSSTEYLSIIEFFCPIITQFDTTIRFVLIFRVAKESSDVVKKRMGMIINNSEVRNLMGNERVEKMYRASVVFKILAWGNFALASLTFLTSTLQFIFITLQLYVFYIGSKIFVELLNITILSGELIYLLTNALYSLFFLLLWKLYKSSKSPHSGYSHFNQTPNYGPVEETIPIFQTLTLVGAQMQKYLLSFYAITVSIITVIIIAFITPLLFIGWKSSINLSPGDYFQFDKSNLHEAMQICSESIVTFPEGSYFCNDFSFATILPDSTLVNQTLPVVPDENTVNGSIWVPKYSMLSGFTDIVALNISMVLNSDVPCIGLETQNYFHEIFSSMNFDCLLDTSYNKANVSKCVDESSCRVWNETFTSSGMLWLSVVTNSSFISQPEFYLQIPIYNISTLGNIENVVNFTNKPLSLSHNIIVDVAQIGYLDFPSEKECVIMFTCYFEFYYPLAIGALILIPLPIYLMVAIIFIHRY